MFYYFLFSLILAVVYFVTSYKKDDEVKTSLIISILIGIVSFLINYWLMPVLMPWGFSGIWFWLTLAVFLGILTRDDIDYKFVIIDYRNIFPAIVVIAFVTMIISTFPLFHAEKYQKMLTVTTVADSTFKNEISPIPVEKMISVDADLAKKIAEDKLGENLGLGSKAEIGDMTIQNITGSFKINGGKTLSFDNDLIWVAPLEHRSIWKWMANSYTDGYVIVSATDPTKIYLVTELNGSPLKMKYIESGFFNDDIERHIKSNGFIAEGLTDHCLEINPNGRPYWVLCTFEKQIGFSGKNSTGVITVDPQTGELQKYGIKNVPNWIDRIHPKDFVEDQIYYWGEYVNGWLNSFFAQNGVQKPTTGTTLVYSNGCSYWYTGIQSAGADMATNGFMLVNTRTKEAKFYRIAGMNEKEARRIAMDRPFAKPNGYKVESPVLYNVKGQPSYFMTYKGSSGNITGYCFVSVTNRQVFGCGSTKKEAEAEYLRMLKKVANDKIEDGKVTQHSKTLVVRDIVNENNVYYILFEGVKGVEFTGSTEFFKELKWTHKGDTVSVSYVEGKETVIALDTFDNLNVEI